MLQAMAVTFDAVVCVLALGLGVWGLRRHQSLELTRRGFHWQSQDWRRRGWMNIVAAVAIGFGALVITARSQYVDLLGMGVAVAWLVLVLRNQAAGRAQ